MAVTIDTAMNELGAGGTNVQDFLQALTASLKGGVGPAKKFGGESSEEKKRAEELKKLGDKLSDGLEENTIAVKQVQKILKEAKETAKALNKDFKNLSSAINRLADNMKSGGGGMGDKKTFDNLNKMAKEAVTGHSLHVHDFTVASKMDILITEFRVLTALMGAGKKGRSKTKSVSDTSVGPSSSGLGSATGLGAASGIGASKELADVATDTRKIYDDLIGQAETLAKKFGLSTDEMTRIIELTAREFNYDEKILLNIERALKHKGHMSQYDRKILEDTISQYRALDKTTATLEEQEQLMKRIGVAAQVAGERMQIHFSDKIQKAGREILNILNMLSPANFGMGPRLTMDPAVLATNAANTMADTAQLTMALGGPIGNITQQIGTWQHSMLDAFMTSEPHASALMMTVQDFNAEMTRLARRGIRSEQDMNDQARTGLGLGRMIGANAEQTSDELANWRQSFNLSAVQARVLSTQIQAIGRATGVTGDNLLAAVKSARALAEQMRNTGSLTDSANASLITFSAVARRMGTEQVTNPLLQAMGNFDPRNPLTPMLIQAASRSGVNIQELMNSRILGTENERPMIDALTQLRDEMRAQLQSGTSLMAVNQMLTARGYNQGYGAFNAAVNTMQEGSRTPQERIAALERSIQQNQNLSDIERRRIEQEIQQLRNTGGATDIAFLQQMSERMGANNINTIGGNRDQISGAVGRIATELGNHMDYNALRERGIAVNNVEELQQFAMQSGRNFNNVINALTDFQRTRQAAGQVTTDPVTLTRMKLMEKQNQLQSVANLALMTLAENVNANTIANTAVTAEMTRATVELGLNIINLGTNIFNLITALGINTAAIGLNSAGMGGLVAAGGPLVLLTAAIIGLREVWSAYVARNTNNAQRDQNRDTLMAAFRARTAERTGAIAAATTPAAVNAILGTIDQDVSTLQTNILRNQNLLANANASDRIGANGGNVGEWQRSLDALNEQLAEMNRLRGLAATRLTAVGGGAAAAPAAPTPEVVAQRQADAAAVIHRPSFGRNLGNTLTGGLIETTLSPAPRPNAAMQGFRTIGGWFGGAGPITSPDDPRWTGHAEGTREIRNTGLAVLHQGEMVVPASIARHLNAEGTGPFQDSVALVRPAGNDALMQRRVQTEFAGTDSSPTMRRANTSLDEISASNNEQVDLMRQELAILRQLLTVMAAGGEGTAGNSTPTPPPNYHQWAVRPLNSPSYGGIENYARG